MMYPGLAVKTMKRILLPFTELFERRNLKRHWWHRLFVVLFFLGLAACAVIGGFVAVAARFALVNGVDSLKLAKDAFPNKLVEPTYEHGLNFYYEDQEFLKRLQPDVPMMSPDHKSIKMVPSKQVADTEQKGWELAVKILPEHGERVSSESVDVAEVTGYRIADIFDRLAAERVGLDMSKSRPCCPENWNVRPVQNVAVIAFPKDMPEDEVSRVCQTLQDRFAAADRRTDIKRWFVVLDVYLAILLFALYTPQVGYRLFLYVVLSPEAK